MTPKRVALVRWRSRPITIAAVTMLALVLALARNSSGATAYRIGPGDQLRIDVGSRTDLSGEYLVTESGTITLPLLGAVKAQGRTTVELADELSRRFSLADRDIPNVTVTLIESRSQKIFVLGAVLIPGAYSFSTPPTAWGAITQAGGASDDAMLSAVEIIPGDRVSGRTTVTIDLASAIREGRQDSLGTLRPGDTVRVPRSGSTTAAGALVYIFGAVGAQGGLQADQAPDLLKALLRAGGPAPGADLEHVEIVRPDGNRSLHLSVDIKDYIHRSNPAGNVPLRPGDTVYVPPRQPRVAGIFSAIGIVGPVLALATSIFALARR